MGYVQHLVWLAWYWVGSWPALHHSRHSVWPRVRGKGLGDQHLYYLRGPVERARTCGTDKEFRTIVCVCVIARVRACDHSLDEFARGKCKQINGQRRQRRRCR